MIDIPEYVLRILNTLEHAGFEAYTVGGCVRDSFLGKTPSDWDVTTSARPEKVLEIFSEFTAIPTGLKHGTVTIISDGFPIEVTTYRIDGNYTDCRHPESVTFSANIEDDLSRRDFTVNAMAYSPCKGFKDPYGGQKDLELGILRCVGDAEIRFTEDALRIMRALRFAATLNFELDTNTGAAIRSCAHLLQSIAKERLCAELSKLLVAKNPEKILVEYKDIILAIAGIKECVTDSVWESNCRATSKAAPILPVRLALLFNRLPLSDSLRHLKFSNAVRHTAEAVSTGLTLELSAEKILVKKLLREFGEENLQYIIEAKSAIGDSTEALGRIRKTVAEIKELAECYLPSHLAISGKDLETELDINGREIGVTLKKLLDAVIYGKCENTRDSLLEFLKK